MVVPIDDHSRDSLTRQLQVEESLVPLHGTDNTQVTDSNSGLNGQNGLRSIWKYKNTYILPSADMFPARRKAAPSRLQSHTLKKRLTAPERSVPTPGVRPKKKRAGVAASPSFIALRRQDSTRGFDIDIIPPSTRTFQVLSAVLVTGPHKRGTSERIINFQPQRHRVVYN